MNKRMNDLLKKIQIWKSDSKSKTCSYFKATHDFALDTYIMIYAELGYES